MYRTRPIEPIENSFEWYSGLNMGQRSNDFIGTMRIQEDANPYDYRIRCGVTSSRTWEMRIRRRRKIRSYRTSERKYGYVYRPLFLLLSPTPLKGHLITFKRKRKNDKSIDPYSALKFFMAIFIESILFIYIFSIIPFRRSLSLLFRKK